MCLWISFMVFKGKTHRPEIFSQDLDGKTRPDQESYWSCILKKKLSIQLMPMGLGEINAWYNYNTEWNTMVKYKIFIARSWLSAISIGVHVEPLEELLKVQDPPDDVPPADGTVVRVQPGPAVSTDEVSPGALEDLALPGVLHIADLTREN